MPQVRDGGGRYICLVEIVVFVVDLPFVNLICGDEGVFAADLVKNDMSPFVFFVLTECETVPLILLFVSLHV